MVDMKSVIIIGLGPAGLFAAKELLNSNFKVIAIEKGKAPKERAKKDLLFGVGGAGLFSDGKLNFSPFIGRTLTAFVDLDEAYKLLDEVNSTFTRFGMCEDYANKPEKMKELKEMAIKNSIRFVEVKQKHIGSDYLPGIIDNLLQNLISKGLELHLETEAQELILENKKIIGIKTNKGDLFADYIIFATGRVGSSWLNKVANSNGLENTFLPVDIGVRVETRTEITQNITDIQYDPKFHIFTKTYDDFVRTFCTNPGGFVVSESYDKFINVNGHSLRDIKTENTNFAFLVKIKLTEPVENSNAYAEHIGNLANFLGSGKPILQRLGDLKAGRRTTWSKLEKNLVQPTLKDVVPGDISLLLPHRIVTDIVEGLEALDKIMPGIASNNTLLYAPEIKLSAMRVSCNKDLQSEQFQNLFFAGDGAGLSVNIVNAACTGIIAAKGIIKQNK
jgi:uncharacterized FAD-dependent dehydrogenase